MGGDERPSYWLTRFVFLRLLGLVYLCAFLVAALQGPALIGTDGLLPANDFLHSAKAYFQQVGASPFLSLPTIFWWVEFSDYTFAIIAWAGVILSGLLFAGYANAISLFLLWALYTSVVNVGQLFWGYGWEILTLEAGFLAMFLTPVIDPRPLAARTPPPIPVMWLLRWLTFRVMFGAGLIKLRGDPCWLDLTCLAYHYETQPIPNPASWYLHHAPLWLHKAGVLLNHFAELLAPVMVLGPRAPRLVGASAIVLFQVVLILSGNLSWLNWLTIAVAVPCFDDRCLACLFPRSARERLARQAALAAPAFGRGVLVFALVALVAYLSLNPILNMFSPRQIMNTSFDPFHLVNTYGAFGTIGRRRYEIVISGTRQHAIGPDTEWLEYEFKCKPGNVARRPCIVSPYHHRVDWQMWFAAMSTVERQPWLVRLLEKLLAGDHRASALLASDPFAHELPRFVKADLYRYEFSSDGKAWWHRTFVRPYVPPISARAIGR